MGGAISSVTAQVMPWSLAAWYGTVEAARLQAVANLLGATHPVIFGLGNLITPAVARAAAVCVSTRLVAVRYAGLGFVVLFPYFLVLLLCPDLVLSAVYGPSSPYAVQTSPLRWFVAIYAMVYIASASKAALSGLGRSPQVSIVSSVSLGLQLAVVLPLAFRGGLPAACLGAFLTYGCEAALAIRFLCRFTAAPRTGAQPVGHAFEVGVDIGTT
jgi:Na+-driven multidrug efflux pump